MPHRWIFKHNVPCKALPTGYSSTREGRSLHFVCPVVNFAPFVILAFCGVACTASRPQQETPLGLVQAQGEGCLFSFEGFDGQQNPSLKQFLGEVERVTQFKFEYSQECVVLLASKRLRLDGNKSIPREQLWPFLQVLLVMNDFVTTGLESEGRFIVEAQAGNGPGENMRIRSNNPHIASGD